MTMDMMRRKNGKMRKYFLLRDDSCRSENKTHEVRDSMGGEIFKVVKEIEAKDFIDANKQGAEYCKEHGLRFYDKRV